MNDLHMPLLLTETVTYAVRKRVALLGISNPPVNGLGHSVRQGLAAGIERALADKDIESVVIHGAGKMFCGGADIRQFNTPAAAAPPSLRDILSKIGSSSKPIIAAIHGVALGGGFELALGCHFRVMQSSAKVGLPEIKLGLIPGGGGTQRLPRLAGVAAAIELILTGAHVPAARALELGIACRVVDGDVLAAAVNLAAEWDEKAGLPLAARVPAPANGEGALASQQARLAAQKRTSAAERAAVECVAAASTLPFEEGLTFERQKFQELVDGSESKAIRHMFFAEREAQRVPDITGKVTPSKIGRLALIGAGTMGVGIAMAFANSNIPVVLIDRDQAAVDRGLANIAKNYEITRKKGKLSQQDVDDRLALIAGSIDLQQAAEADLVIEAVFEEMDVKKDLFRRLEGICRADAILATNTSRLDVNEIASSISTPDRVIGLHFFSPANVMRLLEIVRAHKASPQTVSTSVDVARRIGKTPVVVGVCEGFVGNRMLTAYWRECGFLLEEGASPKQIDDALQKFGMAMGPLAMADLAGMDINWAARKRLAPTRPAHLRYSKVADRICELGRFGQKTGAGYYKYTPGSRVPEPDPVVDAIIEGCAQEAGIARRPISDAEIVERTVFALINEGANILEDGIAQRASDIDLVYVNGYGFPAWRGGPMFYADSIGCREVFNKIERWHVSEGEHWKPSQLLREIAARSGTFNEIRQ